MNDELLDGLDAQQRQVAECLRGPVVVLAGAGTGKTRTLTHRIAHGVRVGAYAPDRVLAVTFTRKAAGELQTRLRVLGVAGVRAQTFHSAARAQLRFFWPQLVGGAAPRLLGGKLPVLAQIADSLGLRVPRETLRDIAAEIEWRKVSMMSAERYAELITAQPAVRPVPAAVTAEQLLDMQQRYEALLQERKQIDFEDVLVLTVGMLQTEPRAVAQVRERYRFFTVDEYQDVSPLQHALLRVWLGEREDLCVVGDASQTIYSFAGASSSYLLRFANEYPNAREFRLERNYRSTAQIVRTANRLMRQRPGALTLQAARGDVAQAVAVEWFASEHDEAVAVASAIRASIDQGVAARDIAVLYRANAQAAPVEAQLQRIGISSQVHGAQRFFDRAEVRQAIMLLRGQATVADPRALEDIVSDVLISCGWSLRPPDGAAARERWEILRAIVTLASEQPPETTVRAFSDEMLARSRTGHEPTVDAVTLSAVHAAKGLEWQLVYLIGMTEGVFPISYADTEATLDEERRLAYVAFTRARDELRVSGTASGSRAPSRFIAEAGLRFIAER